MRTSIVASSFLFAAAVSAFQIETPSGWTTCGPNTLTWDSSSTEGTSVAVLLTNQDTKLLATPIVLVANQTNSPGEPGTLNVAPTTPYPVGAGFQVNFARSVSSSTSLLGQSGNFNITEGGKCGTASASSTTSGGASSTERGDKPNPTDTTKPKPASADKTVVGGALALGLAAIAILA